MSRYLRIFLWTIWLIALSLVVISLLFIVLFYIYLTTKDFPVYLRFPILALAAAFLFWAIYSGLKKGRNKTKLLKNGDVLKSKLP